MAHVERRHMGCVRAWRVCELHGLCEGTARVERASGASCVEGSGSAGAAGAEVEAARESGAWSGPGGGVERAEWSGRARAARGAGWVERSGWSGLSGAGAREREISGGKKK